jgi:hypothetical protein
VTKFVKGKEIAGFRPELGYSQEKHPAFRDQLFDKLKLTDLNFILTLQR